MLLITNSNPDYSNIQVRVRTQLRVFGIRQSVIYHVKLWLLSKAIEEHGVRARALSAPCGVGPVTKDRPT